MDKNLKYQEFATFLINQKSNLLDSLILQTRLIVIQTLFYLPLIFFFIPNILTSVIFKNNIDIFIL